MRAIYSSTQRGNDVRFHFGVIQKKISIGPPSINITKISVFTRYNMDTTFHFKIQIFPICIKLLLDTN